MRTYLALSAAAAVLAAAGATAYATTPDRTEKTLPLAGMRILISNDDSMQAAKASNSDGLGLYELRRAMCAAGADVVVMAPWQVQSGKGTAVTNGGVLTAQRRTALPAGYENDCAQAPARGAVYGVCLADGPCTEDSPSATPADTVKLALRAGLKAKAGWTEAPDVVLTGINSGPNVSASVNDSGTVGAAVAAIDQGVPAIAFSSSGDESNLNFPRVNYRAHAEFGARFLAGLRQRSLLTGEFALKVDYPDVSTGRRAGTPVWTRVGDGAVVYHAFEQRGTGDSFDIALGLCPVDGTGEGECAEGRKDADSTWLLDKGHVTVAPITGDRTYGTPAGARRELTAIERYVEREAPRP
ncbi:5'/3'-nucleotidase SurE [Streptomyces tanashiensis]|uniref:5'/3'-nucleotidase SurE n=1 Tax=Streptomyces tanashiensis TaxID=67367 RepID=UPI00167E3147|nr:5'/3'-nucleotidase SurE [Streptomyces tanashiensis]GGY02081.1 stationary phase survival protein SurE [Streptomyces tanashiensis]